MPPDTRQHASIADYNPFVDSVGPVHTSLYVQVERVLHPHAGDWIPCFRKSLVSEADKFRADKFRRELRIAAQTNLGTLVPYMVQHAVISRGFEALTLDAGPSLNLWRQYRLQALAAAGDAGAAGQPLVTPRRLVDLLITLLKALQLGIHHFGGLHCDLHAGNICIPFERHPTQAQAIRPRIDQLRLIDLGNAVTPGESSDMGPLEIDPDAPEGRSDRFSPALRAALRHDHQAHVADRVHRLDCRIDLFALGWLGLDLSRGIDAASWDAEPAATGGGWPQALDAVCRDLLAQDSDGSPLHDDLHQRFITRLETLRERLGPAPAEGWWLPQRLGSAAWAADASAADTPIAPWAGDDSATPVVPADLTAPPLSPLALDDADDDGPSLLDDFDARAGPAGPVDPPEPARPTFAEPPLSGATPVRRNRPRRRRRPVWPWLGMATLGLGSGAWWLIAGSGLPLVAELVGLPLTPAREAPAPAAADPVTPAAVWTPATAPTTAPPPPAGASPRATGPGPTSAASPPAPTPAPGPAKTAPAVTGPIPPAPATQRPAAAPPAPVATAPKPAPTPPGRIEDRLNSLISLASDGQWARAEALLANLPPVPAPALRPDLRRKLLQGEVEVRALHYDNAEGLFEDVTRAVPQHGPAWKGLGYAQLRQGRLQRARPSLAQALRLMPGDDGGWAFLGEVLAAQGQTDAAAAALQLAVYLAPDRRAALQLLRHDTRALQHSAFQRLVQQLGPRLDKLPPRPRKP